MLKSPSCIQAYHLLFVAEVDTKEELSSDSRAPATPITPQKLIAQLGESLITHHNITSSNKQDHIQNINHYYHRTMKPFILSKDVFIAQFMLIL